MRALRPRPAVLVWMFTALVLLNQGCDDASERSSADPSSPTPTADVSSTARPLPEPVKVAPPAPDPALEAAQQARLERQREEAAAKAAYRAGLARVETVLVPEPGLDGLAAYAQAIQQAAGNSDLPRLEVLANALAASEEEFAGLVGPELAGRHFAEYERTAGFFYLMAQRWPSRVERGWVLRAEALEQAGPPGTLAERVGRSHAGFRLYWVSAENPDNPNPDQYRPMVFHAGRWICLAGLDRIPAE